MTSANGGSSWKNLDRTLAVLLLLGALGHTLGSLKIYGGEPMVLLWALSASVLCVLLGAINLLRVNRPQDAALASICAAGMVAWLACTLAFGHLIGNFLDLRIVIFSLISIGLIFFSLRTAANSKRAA